MRWNLRNRHSLLIQLYNAIEQIIDEKYSVFQVDLMIFVFDKHKFTRIQSQQFNGRTLFVTCKNLMHDRCQTSLLKERMINVFNKELQLLTDTSSWPGIWSSEKIQKESKMTPTLSQEEERMLRLAGILDE